MPNLSSLYRFDVFSPQGAKLMNLGNIARNRTFTAARNATYSAQFDIDIPEFEKACLKSHIDPDSIIASGLNDVKIARGNRYLIGGQMATDQGVLDVDSADLTITVNGWMEYFAQRLTDQEYSYSGVDMGAILWAAINNAQLQPNGSIGIMPGVIQPSNLLTVDYDGEKNIKDILTEITGLQNGPDMEFAPDKTFNVFYPMGAVRNDVRFMYPGNVTKLQVTRDATQIANYIIGKAAGIGAVGSLGDITVQDTASQLAGYKLRQKSISYNDVYDSVVLTGLTNGALATMKLPVEVIQMTVDGNRKPYLGDYWLGDKVPLFVNSKFTTYNRLSGNFYRIDQIQLTLDNQDSEQVVITAVRY